jgi:hypothetical protein
VREFITRHTAYNKHDTSSLMSSDELQKLRAPASRRVWLAVVADLLTVATELGVSQVGHLAQCYEKPAINTSARQREMQDFLKNGGGGQRTTQKLAPQHLIMLRSCIRSKDRRRRRADGGRLLSCSPLII